MEITGLFQTVPRMAVGNAVEKRVTPQTSFAGLMRQTAAAGATEPVSLEEWLRAKYPNLHYHVFDASSGYWRSRNDYPHYLLYQDGSKAKETLENWQPPGPIPFMVL